MAVNRFTGAINANTGTAGNWSLGTVPTATDGHVTTFDATSPNFTTNAQLSCNALDFTGYVNTGTMTNNVFSYGNTTLWPTMNITGIGGLAIIASATFTTNGYQWPNRFALGGNAQSYIFADAVTLLNDFAAVGGWLGGGGFNPTITLNGNLIIKGNYTGSGVQTYNGAYTVYLEGDFIQPQNCQIVGAPWIWNGTTDKTFSCINSTNRPNITINGTGTVTFINNFVTGQNTFTILSPCNTANCNLMIATGATTSIIDTPVQYAGIWKSVTMAVAGPFTVQLNSPLYTSNPILGSSSQQLTLNGSPVYVFNGRLQSGPGNGGQILGTSQIIAIGDKFTYLDSATSVFQGQGVWRIPITVNAGYFLMMGRFVLSTGGSLTINSNKVDSKAIFRNLPELIVQASTTLTNIDKCKFKNVTITAGITITMNKFFTGSPEFKTVIRSTIAATNYNILFTDTIPKKAFFVNIRNCTVNQTLVKNQLNIIGRDANAGFNTGILFGDNGREGFPLNQFPTEPSYSFGNGFQVGGMNN